MKLFKNYSPRQLRDAIEIELQKAGNVLIATRMAIKRLDEDPDYYEDMEKARITKYIRREADGKGGWRYFYREGQGEAKGAKVDFHKEKQRLYNELKEPSSLLKIKENKFNEIKPELQRLQNEFLGKIKNYKIKDEEDKANVDIGKKLSEAILNNKSFEAKYNNGKETITYDPEKHYIFGGGYFASDLQPFAMESKAYEIDKSEDIEKEKNRTKQEYKSHLKKLTPKKEIWQLTKDEASTPITYADMQVVTNYDEQIDFAKKNKAEWLFRGWNEQERIKMFDNAEEAKKYAKDNDGDVYVLGEERDFYRSGQPPKSGRSYNHMDNKQERGVSVYVTPISGSMAGGNITHYGKGRQIGTGGDDEPVIFITNDWKKYKGHKDAVKNALKIGKSVPDEVLKDYPDLKKESLAKAIGDIRPGHKYVRRSPDGKGGYRYFYKEDIKKKFKGENDEENIKLKMKFDSHNLLFNYNLIGFEERIGHSETSKASLLTTNNIEKDINPSGKEKVNVIDRDGNILFHKEGIYDKIEFDENEVKQLRNIEILTHTHPEDVSFSVEDVFLALSLGIKEIRVKTPNDIYSFKISHKKKSRNSDEFGESYDLKNKNTTFINVLNSINEKVFSILTPKVKSKEITPYKAEKIHREIFWDLVQESSVLKNDFNIEYKKVTK